MEDDSEESMICIVVGIIFFEFKIEVYGLLNNFFWFENLFIVNFYLGVKIKLIFNYIVNELFLLRKIKFI